MTRVPTYNSYMNMLSQTMNTKANLDLYNFQALTGLKSPTYSGYGMSASSIVGNEAALGITKNFMENNKILTTEVKAVNTSLEAISKAVNDFKSLLTNFSGMDLEKITPDYTGGEITFGSNEDVYAGTTLTVNGQVYTFTNNGDNTGNNIDLSTLTPGSDTYGADVMNALKEKLQTSDAANFPDFTFDGNKFEFPLYTIDGESSVLDASGVTTGKPHTMNDEQYRNMKELQTMAFTTMTALVDSLNIFANGKYLFGGGVSTQAPIDFPFKTLDEFQSYYDGLNITYPTNSSADLSTYNVGASMTGAIELINNGGNKGTIKATNGSFLTPSISANESTTGDLTFNSDKNTIKATQYGAFNTIKPGDSIVISDAGDTHNGAYIVKSVSADGKTITFEDSTPIRADDTIANGGGAQFSKSFPVGAVINMEGFDNNISPQVQVTGISADGTELYVSMDPARWPETSQTIEASSRWKLDSNSYYRGGELISEKRVNDNQSITLDVNANDPVFEQMFRALGMIAQGNLVDTRNPLDGGTGIDPNETLNRVTEALDLINDALYSGGRNSDLKNPDLYTVQAKMNSNTIILNSVEENLTLVSNNLQTNIDSLKKVDKEEAAVKALLALNQLNASYSVLQAAMSTSLLNYLN